MPDVLVAVAVAPKLAGAKVVLDLHDPTPEVYMTKYRIGDDHVFVRFLKWLERRSIAVADLVLTPNISFRDVFTSRSCPRGKIEVVMNSPQEEVFEALERGGRPAVGRKAGRFAVMYHGTIVERHGLQDALAAVAQLRTRIPGLVFEVYGDGDYVAQFQRRVAQLGLGDCINFHGPVSLEEIAARIGDADVGVIPNLRTPFTEINLPTRILEYQSAGVPVIAPSTRGVREYFDERALFFFEPGDPRDLARALYAVFSQPEAVRRVVEQGRKAYDLYRWRQQAARMLSRYAQLLECGSRVCRG